MRLAAARAVELERAAAAKRDRAGTSRSACGQRRARSWRPRARAAAAGGRARRPRRGLPSAASQRDVLERARACRARSARRRRCAARRARPRAVERVDREASPCAPTARRRGRVHRHQPQRAGRLSPVPRQRRDHRVADPQPHAAAAVGEREVVDLVVARPAVPAQRVERRRVIPPPVPRGAAPRRARAPRRRASPRSAAASARPTAGPSGTPASTRSRPAISSRTWRSSSSHRRAGSAAPSAPASATAAAGARAAAAAISDGRCAARSAAASAGASPAAATIASRSARREPQPVEPGAQRARVDAAADRGERGEGRSRSSPISASAVARELFVELERRDSGRRARPSRSRLAQRGQRRRLGDEQAQLGADAMARDGVQSARADRFARQPLGLGLGREAPAAPAGPANRASLSSRVGSSMKLRGCMTRSRPASRSSSAPGGERSSPRRAGVESGGERVDGEVAPGKVLVDRRRLDLRQRPGTGIALAAGAGDVEDEAGSAHRRGVEAPGARAPSPPSRSAIRCAVAGASPSTLRSRSSGCSSRSRSRTAPPDQPQPRSAARRLGERCAPRRGRACGPAASRDRRRAPSRRSLARAQDGAGRTATPASARRRLSSATV